MDNHLFRVALYDMSIKDLKERRAKRIEIDSIKKAGAKLGMPESVIKRLCKNKQKVFIKHLNGTFAFRHI